MTQDADGRVLIRLGDPPAPVPEPFADPPLQARDRRTDMNTNNRDATWLFPGRRAGRPLYPHSPAELIRDIGLPGTAVRASALRQLVLQAPHRSSPRRWGSIPRPPPGPLPGRAGGRDLEPLRLQRPHAVITAAGATENADHSIYNS
ncbi:hypothetical protein GCM10009551_048120 [Nocardiopsis tropica]